MKKLIGLLAAVTLTVTPVSTVVACGSSSKAEDSDMTANILQSSSLGNIDGASILNGLIKHSNQAAVFGTPDKALTTFMNYFAEAIMEKIADDNGDSNGIISTIKNNAEKTGTQYFDDGTFDSIKSDFANQKNSANAQWEQQVSSAPDTYGKKWKDKLLESFQSQFGKQIYSQSEGKMYTPTSYLDYKDIFISYYILNGKANGSSLATSLQNDIYRWTKQPSGTAISDLKYDLSNSIFNNASGFSIDGSKTINFTTNNSAGKDAINSGRSNSWFGQMDEYINQLVNLKNKDSDQNKLNLYADYLINMINATGGYNAESFQGYVNNTIPVGQIQWATRTNLWNNLSDVQGLSNKLINRWDYTYDSDFGENSNQAKSSNPQNLSINSKFDFGNSISSVFSNLSPIGNEVNGFYSNAQKFVANDYYNNEKPVAVSEIVVAPLYTQKIDYDKQITNSGYTPSSSGDADLMNQFNKFIADFVNNKADVSGNNASLTDAPRTNTSDYSWDLLMKETPAKLPNITDGTDGIDPSSSFTSDFAGKVSFKDHSNFLTMDSSSSDYSDLMKYSIYDFLNNSKNSTDYNFDSTTPYKNGLNDNNNNGSTDSDKAYNSISNFISSMNRTENGANKKMYQVVNANQGIISFVDKDGIHFVRIEGYGLLKNNDKLVNGQKFNNINNAVANGKDANNYNDYLAAEALNNQLSNSITKDSAANITTDYMSTINADPNVSSYDEQNTGLSYNDLNSGFGNKYLQFLANASIAKSNNYSSPKYSFDLNEVLKTYSTGSVSTTPNTSTSMTLMTWDYFKQLLGKSDQELFDYLFGVNNSRSFIYDSINHMNLSTDDENKFKNLYADYINSSLDTYGSRLKNNQINFANNWESADRTIENTEWDNSVKKAGLTPSLTWNDVWNSQTSPSSTSQADSKPTNSQNSYADQTAKLYSDNYWIPFATSNSDASNSSEKQMKSFYYSSSNSEVYKFTAKINEFDINNKTLISKEGRTK